jgi:hypothetical protein
MSHLTTKEELRRLRTSVAALGMRPLASDSWTAGVSRADGLGEAGPVTVVETQNSPDRGRWHWLQTSAGWLLSAGVHAVVMIVLGLTMVSAGALVGSVGVEVAIRDSEDRADLVDSPIVEIESLAAEPSEGGADASAAWQTAPLEALSQRPVEVELAESLSGGGQIADDLAAIVGDGRELGLAKVGSGAGQGEGQGTGKGGSGTGNGYAMFYGSEARGSSFAFVVDCSESMTGRRWELACRELRNSVSALDPAQRFYVVFFNTEDFPQFYPLMDNFLSKAEPANVDKLERWMRNVLPMGGTNPAKALRRALELNPDAVFLLSDGEFDLRPTMQVLLENSHLRTVIHTVALGSRAGERMLYTIAQATGGTYRYVQDFPQN